MVTVKFCNAARDAMRLGIGVPMCMMAPPLPDPGGGMKIREALTFDDVLLEPAASSVLPTDCDTRTRLTRESSSASR